MPEKYIATSVGFLFLGATWWLVWRGDDERVERAGLAFGGLVMPGPVDVRRVLREAMPAVAWAVLLSAICFVPFWLGWQRWWQVRGHFHLALAPREALNEAFGQLIIIALPEEAFYRGYLQSRLDEAFSARVRVLGAELGPGLLLSSAIFALGHLATIHEPARLAVFFPALLFGWLRARTGGVGASVVFHASCNVFSELLGRGYGVY
jgi:membrane protease YdiL (CAAX protease family)